MTDLIESWSRQIPASLFKWFHDDQRPRPILFVGSGLGCEAVPPIPTGAQLAEKTLERLGLPNHGEGLAECLQYLTNDSAGSRSALIDWLKEALLESSATPGGGHTLLVRLPASVIISTNYDNLIEAAAARAGIVCNQINEPGDLRLTGLTENVRYLVPLHGNFGSSSRIVATTDDYIRSFHGRSWRERVREVFRECHVVFIGYSLRDFTTWTSYFENLVERPHESRQHAMIAPTNGGHLSAFWARYQISYVPLKAHQFLAAIHRYLGHLEAKNALASELLVAVVAAKNGLCHADAKVLVEKTRAAHKYASEVDAAWRLLES